MRPSDQIDMLKRCLAHRMANTTDTSGAATAFSARHYVDAERLADERRALFRRLPVVAGYSTQIPRPGDYATRDCDGVPVLLVRQDDGSVRAFLNICRHRGSRVVDGTHGRCSRFVCPYHAWSYDLDGRLVAVPGKETYPKLDMPNHGLLPVDMEIYRGFIFVRLQGGLPSVAKMMAPYDDELAPYRLEDLQPFGRVTLRPRDVNWKNVGDNYSDGLHIPVAHPGLTRLFGRGYGIEAKRWVDKMWGGLIEQPSVNPSERLYQKLLPAVPHLPAERQRLWTYFKLWPNVAFDLYPDQVDFMQWIPVSPTQTMIREIAYALPDERREMKATRYLNWRINRRVNAEDTTLISRVQGGMASRSFSVGPLSDGEVCLKNFARKVRGLIPEARQLHPPPAGWSKR